MAAAFPPFCSSILLVLSNSWLTTSVARSPAHDYYIRPPNSNWPHSLTRPIKHLHSNSPTALPLCSHSSQFPVLSSSHLSTDLLIFPTGKMNLPCALPGASGLVAAYKELRAPSSGVTVGVTFIASCINVPKKDGSWPWRFVWMTPGWRE